MYISFEGPDHTGKSTQAQLLKNTLGKLTSKEILFTKEPGSPHSYICKEIRKLLLAENSSICEKTAMLLFLADRAQHMSEVILPALKAGKIVISDRSSLSTLFYHLAEQYPDQQWPLQVDYDLLFGMLSYAQRTREAGKADLCFIARASYDWSQQSLQKRARLDRIEQKEDRFHRAVHDYFNSFLDRFSATDRLAPGSFLPKITYNLPSIPEHSTEQVAEFVIKTTLKHLNGPTETARS